MKKIYLLLFALCFSAVAAHAQLTAVHVTGTIFEKPGDKVLAYVPFASVYFYNYEDSTRLEYFAFTDMSGQYNVGKIPVKKYRVKIVAPGYQTRKKNVGNFPTEIHKDWGDQVTLHFNLTKKSNDPLKPAVFKIKDLKQSKTDKFNDLITRIDGIMVDKKTKAIVTKKGKSVRLLINGWDAPEKEVDNFFKYPLERFNNYKQVERSHIEYYDLSNQPESLAGGVLNLVMDGQKEQQAGRDLSFTPIELMRYEVP
jgi:hypothetical protein